MIEIDGSEKSGSGTIVRDAIPFSILTGEPVHITNIRAKRPRPGLRPQHVRAIQACAELCAGKLVGVAPDARELEFHPGPKIRGGDFHWDIQTAGSTTMLATAVVPLALFADGPSTYRIRGGLFQDFAPSVYHLHHVLVPLLKAMGADVDVRIIQPGYVPRGQGEIEITARPLSAKLKPLWMVKQGKITEIRGVALSSQLEGRKVSERMAGTCRQELSRAGLAVQLDVRNDSKERPSYERGSVQPGAALAIWARTDTGCLLGADMAGALKRTAEFIGKETAHMLLQDLDSGSTVDRHMADQLIPYAALAEGTTAYRIPSVTDHLESRLWLIQRMLGARAQVQERMVKIQGIGYWR